MVLTMMMKQIELSVNESFSTFTPQLNSSNSHNIRKTLKMFLFSTLENSV